MGQYSYSQPSSSSASSIKSRDRRRGKFGIPKTCWCGGEAVLQTSTDPADLGRLYYTCNMRDDGGLHLVKWFDKAMMGELYDIQCKTFEQEECISFLTQGVNGEEVHLPRMWSQVSKHDREVNFLKQDVQNFAEELSNYKDLVHHLQHNVENPAVVPRLDVKMDVKLGFLLGFFLAVIAVWSAWH